MPADDSAPAQDKHPGGRPTLYDPAYCERVIELGKLGKSKAQIAASLGVVRNTLDNWAAANPEFLSALKDSQEFALAWWEDRGQEGLTAEKFNATAFIYQTKNRFRADYRDKHDHEHAGPNGAPIPVVDLDVLSTEELEAYERLVLKLTGASTAALPGSDQGGAGSQEG